MSATAGRRPTAQLYNEVYAWAPSWDIGRPQRAFVALQEAGLVRSPVLDVGCGTGELALFLARQGFDVLGIDLSPLAIHQARQKARWRGITAHFFVWDATNLAALHRGGISVRTVVDSGMFHLLLKDERDRFLQGIDAIVEPDGLYCVLGDARSDPEATYGLTPREIKERFAEIGGWEVVFSVEAVYERRWGGNHGYFIVVRKR